MRTRGFSLPEVMIATALTGMVSTGLLMMVRGELVAFATSDQLGKAQIGSRAGMDLLEGVMRRSCSGVALGAIGLNLAGAQRVTSCVRVWDGAVPAGGSFTAGSPTAAADALELVYATSTATLVTAPPVLTTAPSVTVADASTFAVGDYVLVGDYQQADLFQVSAIAGNQLSLGALAAPVVSPSAPALTLAVGSVVMKARSISVYVDATTKPPMLMLDPDGMAGSDHADAQPLVEGALDLQLAVGIDGDGDGVIAESGGGGGDEWWGNAAGELTVLPAPPWNNGVGYAQPRQLRATLLVQTTNSYSGAVPALGPYEDRTAYASTSLPGPRYRSSRMVVAPRIWNLGE
jgi:prepilin-type N-terminal cleavage/methylation domain-containing protein